jgi:predicted NAD/FAD-dependent oxidoreductase
MEYDYIIIGAGIAGLYAGYKLSDKTNKKILIIEKNSYIGGRAQNINFHGSQVPIGAGIGRYKKDKLLKALLKTFNIPINKFTININYSFDNLDVKKIFDNLKSKYLGEKHLTFKQYALKHLGKEKYNLLTKSIGLTDYENEDVEETLFWYEMQDNIGGWGGFYVPWNDIISNLAQSIHTNGNKIKKNCQVIKIETKNDKLEITTSEKKYFAKKVIIACEIQGIQKLLPEFSRLYSNIKANSFMRIYAHFNKTNSSIIDNIVTNTTYVNSLLYKIIPINKSSGIYMIAYSDNKAADKLNLLLNSDDKIVWLEKIVSKSLNLKEQIKINDLVFFYWKNGTHYFRPLSETIYKTREKYIEVSQNPKSNIYVCGEAVARSHGWVEGALESVELIL